MYLAAGYIVWYVLVQKSAHTVVEQGAVQWNLGSFYPWLIMQHIILRNLQEGNIRPLEIQVGMW